MKKKNLHIKLLLGKNTISSFSTVAIKGGTVNPGDSEPVTKGNGCPLTDTCPYTQTCPYHNCQTVHVDMCYTDPGISCRANECAIEHH
ncbi:MAG: hypothetical protein AAF617_15945 [Bacteroidota bacterium]